MGNLNCQSQGQTFGVMRSTPTTSTTSSAVHRNSVPLSQNRPGRLDGEPLPASRSGSEIRVSFGKMFQEEIPLSNPLVVKATPLTTTRPLPPSKPGEYCTGDEKCLKHPIRAGSSRDKVAPSICRTEFSVTRKVRRREIYTSRKLRGATWRPTGAITRFHETSSRHLALLQDRAHWPQAQTS